jgi:hypothetical protein
MGQLADVGLLDIQCVAAMACLQDEMVDQETGYKIICREYS